MRRRFLFAVVFTAISVAAWSDPIKYTVFVSKEKVGSLTSDVSGDDDSGYVEDSLMSMTHDGKSVGIHEIIHYGKDGVATSRSMELTGGDQEVKIKAVLGDDGAKVTLWNGDQKDEKQVSLATKTSRADATNFWFKKSAPKVGDSVTYQTFNIQELKWSDVTLKYVGKSKTKIGDKDVEENEIDRTDEDGTSQIYVDDKGDADLIVDGEMRIERQM